MKDSIIWAPLTSNIDQIEEAIHSNDGIPHYVRIDTTSANDPDRNLISLALRDSSSKELLVGLTKLGFYTYWNTTNETRLIHHDRVSRHWPAVKDGTYTTSSCGLVYSYEPPSAGIAERLVVVFSPLSSRPRLARYFMQSFKTIQKYLPPQTAILRIADLGGVKGAFYLNTKFLPNNADKVANFINQIIKDKAIAENNVVLYGASKGATAAVYHGITSGLKFVAVDPVLADEWYEKHNGDYHFTADGIFCQSKEAVFETVIRNASVASQTSYHGSIVITAPQSPQQSYIYKALGPIAAHLTFLESTNPMITEHPEVAPNTIYAQVLAINLLLLGQSLPEQTFEVP